MGKQITFNAFDMTSAMHNSHGQWKHPNNERAVRYKDLDYWVEPAKLLGVVPAKLPPPAIRNSPDYNKLFKYNTSNSHTPVRFRLG